VGLNAFTASRCGLSGLRVLELKADGQSKLVGVAESLANASIETMEVVLLTALQATRNAGNAFSIF
jgi:hypothetical protein